MIYIYVKKKRYDLFSFVLNALITRSLEQSIHYSFNNYTHSY